MVFIEKYEFTYYDYLCYYSSIKSISEKFLHVSEDTSEYALEEDERQLEKKTGDKKHDKIFIDFSQCWSAPQEQWLQPHCGKRLKNTASATNNDELPHYVKIMITQEEHIVHSR